MKTDLYTKIILTVIAFALLANFIKSSITPVMADNKKYVSLPINTDGSIDVNIKKVTSTIDVNIESVEKNAFYLAEPLEVKIKE